MFIKKRKTQEREPENPERALAYTLFLLNIRARSEAEIKEKMLGRGFALPVIRQTLKRLKELRYINDEAYAETIVDNCKRFKPWGYQRVKLKLVERQIPPRIIESVLVEYFSEDDELIIAKAVLKKEVKGNSLGYELKQKWAGKLQQRGFRYAVIKRAIDSLREDA